MSLKIKKILNTEEDLELFEKFYNLLMLTEFPDPDERDSIENFIKCLKNNEKGEDKYCIHLLIYTDIICGDIIMGGIIFNFVSELNCGILEYIVVDTKYQHVGMGQKLHLNMIDTLNNFSKNSNISFILAESNFKHISNNVKAFFRNNNYKILDFNYKQPALDINKRPALGLSLLLKSDEFENEIPTEYIQNSIVEYARLAMGRTEPYEDPTIIEMITDLKKLKNVKLIHIP